MDDTNQLGRAAEENEAKVPDAPAPVTPDDMWQRRQRRETALHMANQTHGKHAKPEKVLETARTYLDFIEG